MGEGLPIYNVRSIPMDTALTDKEVELPGNSLTVSTDGSLSGVTIKFDSVVNDTIPLDRFKDFLFYPFSKIYVTFTAQAGKTLYLFVGRETLISAATTAETQLGRVALCITQWGGFEDEVLLKAGADPAALAAATKFTPTLPSGATVWKAYLVMKFREIYCAAANYVKTAGSVQVEKSTDGSWATGITVAAGTLDVAAGASAGGDCLIGNADVSAQVASGSEVEFQLVTLRSNADDLALRDVQLGLQIYFTV